MTDYNFEPDAVEYEAPENSITLNIGMNDGADVKLTVSGYENALQLFAALHHAGKPDFIQGLAESMLANREDDDDE